MQMEADQSRGTREYLASMFESAEKRNRMAQLFFKLKIITFIPSSHWKWKFFLSHLQVHMWKHCKFEMENFASSPLDMSDGRKGDIFYHIRSLFRFLAWKCVHTMWMSEFWGWENFMQIFRPVAFCILADIWTRWTTTNW